MSFIRAKKFSNGRVYYYLVEGHRVDGRVRQKVLRYLGKEVPKDLTFPTPKADLTAEEDSGNVQITE